jgi:hypothetical protein
MTSSGTKVINVARDFSRFPAGRFKTDGPFPGEIFRDQWLEPALNASHEKVLVELDGTLGYGSSFLEEAFGGLVRLRSFTAGGLRQALLLRSRDSSLISEIWGYIDNAKPSTSRP